MKVQLSEIVWDTEVDGVIETPEPALPSTMTVDIPTSHLPSLFAVEEDALSAASDQMGWCILNCKVAVL